MPFLNIAVLAVAAAVNAQQQRTGAQSSGNRAVCGGRCQSDVQCPDPAGVCTYCTRGVCRPPTAACGGPAPRTGTKPSLLAIGDSISIGWAPVLFPMLSTTYEAQHDPINAGPASKGFECVHDWVGNQSATTPWDVILFNFGLHSLDRSGVCGVCAACGVRREWWWHSDCRRSVRTKALHHLTLHHYSTQ